MGADRVTIDVAVQYVDHNLLEADNLNQEEHLFLRSACRRYSVWYSPPGTGISHPTHMQHFGKPGDVLIGGDSHTAAAGSLGMFAVGMGGLDVALAMVGETFYHRMPEVWGVKLSGSLPEWVSAKDVGLEMLRRHGVTGASGRILEYYGPVVSSLSAMDRHVIANMGVEMGATTTVFPSDDRTRAFLSSVGRADDWPPWRPIGRPALLQPWRSCRRTQRCRCGCRAARSRGPRYSRTARLPRPRSPGPTSPRIPPASSWRP
ncbi:aconitase family protein [Streptomyces spiralis]